MSLGAHFRLKRGALEVAVDLDVAAGETVALVGPNGSGKSTLLHAIAGLLSVDEGAVTLDGRTLDGGRSSGTGAGPGNAFVAPEDRRVGFVFQDLLLFPHLTALENVAFGAQSRGVPRARARADARAWLARVGLEPRAAARPAQLSGGQAQRVALARALASEPRVLLLDEPLSAIDASARLALRRDLRAHLAAFAGPRLLVAHDAVDAFALADRVAVMESGRIVQVGRVDEICSRPRSRYVADLVGLNCFRGDARGGVVQVPGGGALVTASTLEGPVFVTVHPRAVALYGARPVGSPRNVWSAPVLGREASPEGLRVQVGGALPLVVEVTQSGANALDLQHGRDVWVALKATEIVVYPA